MGNSTTNFRVVKVVGMFQGQEAWSLYGVHRVYYEDGKPYSISEEQACPVGENRDQLIEDWARYGGALEQPVLVYDWDAGAFIGEEERIGTVFA